MTKTQGENEVKNLVVLLKVSSGDVHQVALSETEEKLVLDYLAYIGKGTIQLNKNKIETIDIIPNI